MPEDTDATDDTAREDLGRPLQEHLPLLSVTHAATAQSCEDLRRVERPSLEHPLQRFGQTLSERGVDAVVSDLTTALLARAPFAAFERFTAGDVDGEAGIESVGAVLLEPADQQLVHILYGRTQCEHALTPLVGLLDPGVHVVPHVVGAIEHAGVRRFGLLEPLEPGRASDVAPHVAVIEHPSCEEPALRRGTQFVRLRQMFFHRLPERVVLPGAGPAGDLTPHVARVDLGHHLADDPDGEGVRALLVPAEGGGETLDREAGVQVHEADEAGLLFALALDRSDRRRLLTARRVLEVDPVGVDELIDVRPCLFEQTVFDHLLNALHRIGDERQTTQDFSFAVTLLRYCLHRFLLGRALILPVERVLTK